MGKFSLLAVLGVLALLAEAHAMPQSGSDSSSEESAETRETMVESRMTRKLMEEIRAVCRNYTGSDEAYVGLAEAIGSSMVCVMTSFDVKNFTSDVETLSDETRTTFFQKYYPQLKRAGPCLYDVLKAARPCFNGIDFMKVVSVAGLYKNSVDLICKHDGEFIFKLAEPKYKECVENLEDNLMECMESFERKRFEWTYTHIQHRSKFGLRDCIEDKLNVCEAPDIIRVYDLFHDIMMLLPTWDDICPFLRKDFIPFVKSMSTLTKNETNKVNKNMSAVTKNETYTVNENLLERVTFRLIVSSPGIV